MSGEELPPVPGSSADYPVDDFRAVSRSSPDASMIGGLDDEIKRKYDELVEDLAGTLDLSAGLRLALVPKQHERLIRGIASSLDLDDGYAAIVQEPEGANDLRERLRYQARDVKTLGGVIEWLNAYPVRDRLDFRTHTALPGHAKKVNCGCVTARQAIIRMIMAHANRLVRVEGFEALEALRAALTQAMSFERPFQDDLEKVRRLVEEIRQGIYERGLGRDVRDEWAEVAENLSSLERTLNDYTQADLRSTRLEGLRLVGLRWSSNTLWPDGWREIVARHSSELSPGHFVIDDTDPILRGADDV